MQVDNSTYSHGHMSRDNIHHAFVGFAEFVGAPIVNLTYSHGHIGRDDLNDAYEEPNTHVYSDFPKSSTDMVTRCRVRRFGCYTRALARIGEPKVQGSAGFSCRDELSLPSGVRPRGRPPSLRVRQGGGIPSVAST